MNKSVLIISILILLTLSVQAKEKYSFVRIENLIEQDVGRTIIQ